MVITVATDNLLASCVQIPKRKVHLIPELQVSCGDLGNLFLKIGLEVQKPAGSSVSYAHLPLEKLSYLYYKTDDTSQKSNFLANFLNFFFVSSLSSSSK
jgi:hypothetical protein